MDAEMLVLIMTVGSVALVFFFFFQSWRRNRQEKKDHDYMLIAITMGRFDIDVDRAKAAVKNGHFEDSRGNKFKLKQSLKGRPESARWGQVTVTLNRRNE